MIKYALYRGTNTTLLENKKNEIDDEDSKNESSNNDGEPSFEEKNNGSVKGNLNNSEGKIPTSPCFINNNPNMLNKGLEVKNNSKNAFEQDEKQIKYVNFNRDNRDYLAKCKQPVHAFNKPLIKSTIRTNNYEIEDCLEIEKKPKILSENFISKLNFNINKIDFDLNEVNGVSKFTENVSVKTRTEETIDLENNVNNYEEIEKVPCDIMSTDRNVNELMNNLKQNDVVTNCTVPFVDETVNFENNLFKKNVSLNLNEILPKIENFDKNLSEVQILDLSKKDKFTDFKFKDENLVTDIKFEREIKRKRERSKVDISSIINSIDDEVLIIEKLNSNNKKLFKKESNIEFNNLIKDSNDQSDKKDNFEAVKNLFEFNQAVSRNKLEKQSLLVQNNKFLNFFGNKDSINLENEQNTTRVEFEKYCSTKDRNTIISRELIIKFDKILDFIFSNQKKFSVKLKIKS